MMRRSQTIWLPDSSESARRILSHDWSASPLGALETWPQSWRSAVLIMLQLPTPAVLLWGADGIVLHNDAFARRIHAGSTSLLGSRIGDAAPHLREFMSDVLAKSLLDTPAPAPDGISATRDDDSHDDLWPTLAYQPVLDEAGTPQGVLGIAAGLAPHTDPEKALHEARARLSAICTHAAVGLSELSPQGKFVQVNDELCRMLGRSREQLLSSGVAEITHPDDAVAALAGLRRVLDRGVPVATDMRCARADGAVVWANTIFTRIDDERGNPSAVIAVTIDLTARKERESHAAFLIDLQRDFDWTGDLRDMLQLAGDRAYRHLGVARLAFVETEGSSGRLATVYDSRDSGSAAQGAPEHPELSGPQFRAELQADRIVVIADVATDPRAAALAAEYRNTGVGACALVPFVSDGLWRFTIIAQRRRPHRWGDDELALLRELATRVFLQIERVRAEVALWHSQQQLKLVLETAPVSLLYLDRDLRIHFVNRVSLQSVGRTAAEVLGRNVADVLGAEIYLRVAPFLSRALAGERLRHEIRIEGRNGFRDLLVHYGADVGAAGAVQGIVAAIQDITDRKHSDERLRLNETELEQHVHERTADLDAANAALRDEIIERRRSEITRHDRLRQVVNAQEEERRRISRELHDEVGQHLTALTLGLKSLQAGSWSGSAAMATVQSLQGIVETIGKEVHDLALELRPTSLDDLGLVQTLSNYIDEWSARAKVEADFHSRGWDGRRLSSHIETTLYRIVREALNNVLKHAGATRVSVIVERRADQAVAIIEDDGVGFSVDAVTSADPPHRLGVLGMRERAALVGGEVNIESRLHGGTTVFVRIPIPAEEGERP